ncbi:MAG: prolipoprotein diacylglyceryl transferase [Nitrospirae bacterium]|nr:prolipoprotein diacylglyceryl transferase [Nitrospirota bacterium]
MHPILLKFGPIEIRYYGVMIALAFIIGAMLGEREAQRRGFRPGHVYDMLFYVLLSSILGARLYYVLFSELGWFLAHPLEILAIWRGGLSLHGGLIGGVLAGAWYCRRHGLPVLAFSDVMTPSIILGQAIGRVGCTLNGCSFGRPTDVPWAVVFTDLHSLAPLGVPLHPTQLYELGLDLIFFGILWGIRKRTAFDGQLFAIYLMGYGVIRFILEFFRGDSLFFFNLLPVAQAISIGIVLSGILLYLYLARRGSRVTAPVKAK